MPLSLQQYCEKHDLELIKEYTTLGEECSNHRRALVRDKKTSELQHLYYDSSYRRRSLSRQKRDYEEYTMKGLPTPFPDKRGWRNTTLDNRRRKQRTNDRKLAQIVS